LQLVNFTITNPQGNWFNLI